MARAITGRVPTYRSGDRTRTALRAAGARAATLDGTLYLPGPPPRTRRATGVIAHELAHVAEGRSRAQRPAGVPRQAVLPHTQRAGSSVERGTPQPRFFLDRLSQHAADAGERTARRVGDLAAQRMPAAGSTLSDAADTARSLVGRRPGLGDAADAARSLVPGLPAAPSLPDAGDALRGLGMPAIPDIGRALPSDVPGAIDAVRSLAPGLPAAPSLSDAGDALRGLGVPSLPDVGSLPVGGAAGALGAARRMLEAGPVGDIGRRAVAGTGDMASSVTGMSDRATNAVSDLTGMAGAAAADVTDGLGAAGAAASEAASSVGQTAAGLVDRAGAEAAGALSSLLGGAASAATDAESQITALVEVLEERLLAELERRGGRYAGVF
ncbi:hypothetical protein BH23ACT10_BH23ACT10_38050 [soil metagenome]